MEIPYVTMVGLEEEERASYILVQLHGLQDPVKVPSSSWRLGKA